MRAGIGLALILAAVCATKDARAETPPSPWAVAKDPRIGRAWAAHLEYERQMTTAELFNKASRSGDDGRAFRESAKGVLVDAHARESNDPLLLFDLGTCDELLGEHKEAIEVLSEALARWPDHPAAEEAWLHYAFANARLERPGEERRAYERFLALATEAPRRLVPMLNMAEADMRAGDLDAAVGGYRTVLRDAAGLPNTPSNITTSALAKWGLAVALDRQGDLSGAARTAKQATEMDPTPAIGGRGPKGTQLSYAVAWAHHDAPNTVILDRVGVFFVPEYERNWYLALGDTELAKAEPDPRKAAVFWRGAESSWALYVRDASRALKPDRWIAIAERRLASCKAARADAEARASKLPPLIEPRDVFIE